MNDQPGLMVVVVIVFLSIFGICCATMYNLGYANGQVEMYKKLMPIVKSE